MKRLVGCSVFLVLLVVGIALLAYIGSGQIGGSNGSANEEAELGQELTRQFGNRPAVKLVCYLPVVGEAPCLPGEGPGRRQATLTFTDYELPTGVDPQIHARRIVAAAYEASSFIREADKTEVVFHEGDESASVLRRYSFGAGEIGAEVSTEGD